jgi:oxygen-independent coproporphyrinogen-3 oxidase
MIDAAPLVRFVKPGPRYTSYPPATEFHSDFGPAEARAELARIARDTPASTLSIYCHVPFCPSLCWYCGCNVVISRNRDNAAAYVETLAKELALIGTAVGPGRRITEVSLGGGSPNFLRIPDLMRLLDGIRRPFELAADAELGVELDPRETDVDQIKALAEAGFTRVSLGVQDFADAVQDAIHRHQSVDQTHHLVDTARSAGFTTVNADLVYGLPQQTPESFRETLDAVVGMRPDRIALFGYAHLPHLRPHQKLVERSGPLPDTAARATLVGIALEAFANAGYVRVGMDHFALPSDSLAHAAVSGRLGRNFQGYVVERADAIIACGTTGISGTGGAYWQNHADLEVWRRAVDAGELPVARGVGLDADDRLRRFVIERLMCDNALAFGAVEDRFPIQFEAYFAEELSELERGELPELARVDRGARRIEATPLGHDLIRNVCMVFDRYLKRPPSAGERPRFSPTL